MDYTNDTQLLDITLFVFIKTGKIIAIIKTRRSKDKIIIEDGR